MPTRRLLFLMGVSGRGKSTIGVALVAGTVRPSGTVTTCIRSPKMSGMSEHPMSRMQAGLHIGGETPPNWTSIEGGILDSASSLSPGSASAVWGCRTSTLATTNDDWRLTNPRFLAGAFESNLAVVGELEMISREVGATPAQVSLAWLLALGEDWSPIPGTIRIEHLEENLGALEISFTTEQLQRLNDLTPAVGDHHTAAQLAMFDR